MKYPSWSDVGIPLQVVQCLKTLKPGSPLDYLIHQLVFRNRRKAYVMYWCDDCSTHYTPNLQSEDYPQCGNCGSRRIRVTTTLRYAKDTVTLYSRSYKIQSIIKAMTNNHLRYFKRPYFPTLDCGWSTNGLYCAFAGGEKSYDTYSPQLAIIKSSILCPYLWDLRGGEPIKADHISSALAQIVGGKNQ